MREGAPFPNPLWAATAAPPVEVPPWQGDGRADVAVIGGGVTGCSAALPLAERGADVRLFEGKEIGWGTSGRAGGQVIAGYHLDPEALIAVFGDGRGERMVEFGGAAPGLLFDLVAKHGIDCDARRSGWMQVAVKRGGLRALRRRMEQWQRRGAPVEWLERERLAALIGSNEYAGGWLDRRGGSIQPLSYVRGLARAAMRAGAKLHAHSEVIRIARRDAGWQVETRGGTLRAEQLLIGTNAYTGRLWPRLHGAVIRAHSVQIATAPLDEDVRSTILPEGQACTDARLFLRYFRLDAAGRLVMGGVGGLAPPSGPGEPSFRLLERTVRRMFPQIRDPRFEFHWYGKGAVTFDMLPHLYEPAPGMTVVLGYAGRGLAMGTALGTLLARRALGEPLDALPFPCWPLRAFPFAALAGVGVAARVAAVTLFRR